MMFSAGGFVGWTMNTSLPRTFSSMRTKISPSANRVSVTLHSSDAELPGDLFRQCRVGRSGEQLESVAGYR